MANPAMPGIVKIGRSNNPARRADELSRTSVPHPFQVIGAVPTNSPTQLEARVHAHFARQRAAYNREFFCVSPEEAFGALRRIAAEMNVVVIDVGPPGLRGLWWRWNHQPVLAQAIQAVFVAGVLPWIIIFGGLVALGVWDAIVGR